MNVDNAPELGEQQMEEFERGLPDSFHENHSQACNYNGSLSEAYQSKLHEDV